ncbi:MAG: CHAD domain-containing protein [Blastocatellia bacterium]|nr:CHAD domain-containing protein [Blastocatellia bacterium]
MARPLKVRKISPDDRLEKAAERIMRTRIKEFYSCWPDPDRTPTPEQLHNLRISGKRLRYSAENLRELYPDRLALLIDLLKVAQDTLGEIQDCVTQRGLIEASIARMRRRDPRDDQIATLEKIVSEYERRQSKLFMKFRETWLGMSMDEFRASLKAMVSRVIKPKREKPVRVADKEAREPVLRVIAGAEISSADQTGEEGSARRPAREQGTAEALSVDQTGD